MLDLIGEMWTEVEGSYEVQSFHFRNRCEVGWDQNWISTAMSNLESFSENLVASPSNRCHVMSTK